MRWVAVFIVLLMPDSTEPAANLKATRDNTNNNTADLDRKWEQLAKLKLLRDKLATTSAQQRGWCYDGPRTLDALDGTWELDKSPVPYWNLSCPFEWTKYSCSHQGDPERARQARMRFVPTNCALHDDGGIALALALGPHRRLLLIGDSLVRQVYIALGCLLHPVTTSTHIPWSKEPHGCQGAAGCIASGPHSWFSPPGSHFTLTGGGIVEYRDPKGWHQHTPPETGDVVVVEGGVHGVASKTSHELSDRVQYLATKNKGRPEVVWMETPPPAFRNDAPGKTGGEYNTKTLERMKKQGKSLSCVPSVVNVRTPAELRALKSGGLEKNLAGAVRLAGIETLGHAKIGGHVGTYGDCTHYCMPGVPDQLARALVSLTVATLERPDATEAG